MNKIVVIYQSTYGTTRLYAEQIAKELGADLLECKKAKISELIKYDTIIFGGGIYAGKIAGRGLLRKNFKQLSNKRLIVFSVGFTPQSRIDTLESVRSNSFKGILSQHISFFHFRGAVNYKKLNLLHRFLLSAKRLSILIKSRNKLTDANKKYLNQYGKSTELVLDSSQSLIVSLKV